MGMIWGLVLGAVYAVGDGALFYWVMGRAARQPASSGQVLARGLAARGLLTAAIVILGLLLPFVNAAGVVIALLIQKVVLVLLTLAEDKKNRG